MTRKCCQCKQELELTLDNFPANAYQLEGFSCYCHTCHNKNRRKYYKSDIEKSRKSRRKQVFKREYGITHEDYDRMELEQEGKCAICGGVPVNGRGKRLVVDHDHSTGQVRQLLCSACNFGIGNFNDNTELMNKAIQYLAKFN